MLTVTRRNVLALGVGFGLWCHGAAAMEGMAAPLGKSSSRAARTGAAPFETAHLIPKSGLELSLVDRDLSAARVVALTIDDGPHEIEMEMMALLAAEGARATFFAIGSRVAGHSDLTRRLVDAGHEVGCHSFTHPMMGALSARARDREFQASVDVLARVGVRPAWFRPPYGDWDDDLVARARQFGMRTVTWTVDARDWKTGVTAERVARRVITNLDPAAVVLTHGTKPTTLAALPAILAEGRRRGVRFVTMTEWFEAMSSLVHAG